MFATTVPDYILSSGITAQRSRTHSGRGRLSIASDVSVSSSSPEYTYDLDESIPEIKAVLGYIPAPQHSID
ncbi:hypothetical protein EV178_000482 [Coemansia sp. RSA 1646]|nr:hypothetical protein EV178_000482 [Coemansia sp. RSA 1646]